jgi:hypothetical protein
MPASAPSASPDSTTDDDAVRMGEGAIPSAKLGNRGGFGFKRDDLDRFLDSRRPHDA